MSTDATTRRQLKVILCGTNYGASYLPAIEQAASAFKLVGIVARGSERSLQLAKALKAPLWSSAEEIPAGVAADVAVIALPPVAAAALAKELIGRGIHLLMEHPVDADVLQDIREQAQSAKIAHNVNCHFAELTAPRAFVTECRRRAALGGGVQYASVVTSPRGAYSTFDLLGRALGGLVNNTGESLLEREAASPSLQPFASYSGSIGGVPLRVQCSEAMGAVDDGSDSPIPQRVEIGFEDGNLMMLSPIGPLVWSERLRLALRDHKGPLWVNLAEPSVTFTELLRDRVNANRRALEALAGQVHGGPVAPHQSTAWLTTVAEMTRIVRASSSSSSSAETKSLR